MGEIIQFEGVAYKKVDRQAKVGDVVIPRVSTGLTAINAGHMYKVVLYSDSMTDKRPYIEGDFGKVLVYGTEYGRNRETVDVYERVEVMEPTPAPESEYERQQRYLAHPFYKEVRDCWQITQGGQIRKGAEKYDEPFNPASWSASELLEHAMQENVDQAHYMYGLYVKMYEMETELKELREFRDQVQKTVVKWGAMNEPKSGDA